MWDTVYFGQPLYRYALALVALALSTAFMWWWSGRRLRSRREAREALEELRRKYP